MIEKVQYTALQLQQKQTTMAEEIINYSGNKTANWLKNKKKGLTNRYHKYKRYFLWALHTRLNNIDLNYSKIAKDSIPILINNFNRLDLLKQQIAWLLTVQEKISIIIVDNRSTYPPLLEYYNQLDYPNVQVVYLHFNSWRKGVEYLGQKKLKQFSRYIVTDPDLLPYENTPDDFISHLSAMLDKYPAYNHVGASLEINDLPDYNPLKATIFKHESQFWTPKTQLLNEEVYIAPVDTTFAMYRNTSKVIPIEPALRTARPYTLKHVDWYRNPAIASAEYDYYFNSCKSFASWTEELKRIRNAGKKQASPTESFPRPDSGLNQVA